MKGVSMCCRTVSRKQGLEITEQISLHNLRPAGLNALEDEPMLFKGTEQKLCWIRPIVQLGHPVAYSANQIHRGTTPFCFPHLQGQLSTVVLSLTNSYFMLLQN